MEETRNSELRIAKTFKTPTDLMWDAWTNPEHLVNWWGPDGFTITNQEMDFQEGGGWKMTLQGPGGTNYPNRSIFKEIILLKKIVFEHFNPHFITTVLFESKGEETQIDWTLLFETAEMHNTIIKAHKADEGQKQNLKDFKNIFLNYTLDTPGQQR